MGINSFPASVGFDPTKYTSNYESVSFSNTTPLATILDIDVTVPSYVKFFNILQASDATAFTTYFRITIDSVVYYYANWTSAADADQIGGGIVLVDYIPQTVSYNTSGSDFQYQAGLDSNGTIDIREGTQKLVETVTDQSSIGGSQIHITDIGKGLTFNSNFLLEAYNSATINVSTNLIYASKG